MPPFGASCGVRKPSRMMREGVLRGVSTRFGTSAFGRVPPSWNAWSLCHFLLRGWSKDFAAIPFMARTFRVCLLSMTALADGFRVEGGAGADKTVALRSELGAPMVSLGVPAGADHDDLLESEHSRSFQLNC